MNQSKLHSSLILTHRCNLTCQMCNIWKNQTCKQEEAPPEVYRKLPFTHTTNIGGGEVFLMDNLEEYIGILVPKTNRIGISTNGVRSRRILEFSKKFPNIGIRISIDGLDATNNKIRGSNSGFSQSLNTLEGLKSIGVKDIGVSFTVQDENYMDLMPVFNAVNEMGGEFSTGVVQNSHYYMADNNEINKHMAIKNEIQSLVTAQLKSSKLKNWFRAYYNNGLISSMEGRSQLNKCNMGSSSGFVTDPFGNVLPCHNHPENLIMGNLVDQSWNDIWYGERAKNIRKKVKQCSKKCWTIATVAPEIHSNPIKPATWVLKEKLKLTFKL